MSPVHSTCIEPSSKRAPIGPSKSWSRVVLELFHTDISGEIGILSLQNVTYLVI